MKFTIDTVDFKNAMEKAYKAVNVKLPGLKNVRLHIEEENSYVLGTNLENFVLVKIDAYGCRETLDIMFKDTATLIKAMQFFTGDSVVFEAEVGKVSIRCGNKYMVQEIFAENEIEIAMPELETSSSEQYQYNTKSLKERFNLIKYAVGKANVQARIHTGIHFKGNDMVATDGYRLALSKSNELRVKNQFTMTAASILLALDVLGKKLDKNIEIVTTDKYVKMFDRDTTIISKLLDGEYLDYRNVMPKGENKIRVNVLEFTQALKYFKAFMKAGKVDADQKIVWLNDTLHLHGTNTNCTLESIDNSRSTFKCPIAFNSKYMLEAISKFKTENVAFGIESAQSPMVIENDDDYYYVALVLPVRINPEELNYE